MGLGLQDSHTASLTVEIESATISYDSLEERHDAEETHYLLVTKLWRLECVAAQDSLIAKVCFKSTSTVANIFCRKILPAS